ncbi:MAG: hypothetical protein KF802_13075 [Bdellovibrionaceae bacterium]|nr:hypothetical protein [Pseudobdellovibrionaceae bacterium]
MSNFKSKHNNAELDSILNYVDASKGLEGRVTETGKVQIRQDVDRKEFSFYAYEVGEVLQRADADGKAFLQLNFKNGTKVLLTEALVGFKPVETFGLDMNRLPKVVTTPDLLSVYEAIEEALGSDTSEHEVEILKKVYQSILLGAEKVGFELTFERRWSNRLMASKIRASA